MSRKDYWDFEQPLADEGWTLVETGSSTAERLAAAAWPERGATGLRVTAAGTSQVFVRQTSWCQPPTAGQTRAVGFWYRQIAQATDADYNYQLLLYAGASKVAAWWIYDAVSGWAGAVRCYDDPATNPYATYDVPDRPVLGRWTYVQVTVTRASSSTASDGSAALYFDGVKIAEAAGVDNYDLFDTDGELYLGSVILGRDGYSADVDEVVTGESLADVEPYAAAPLTAYPEARRTVCLVPDSDDGREFADYVVQQTALPRANVCILPNASSSESLADYATFQAEVETDLAAWLANRPTVDGRLAAFLIGPGVPGYFSSGDVKHSATSRLMHYPAAFSSQAVNPLYDPSTVARLTAGVLQAAGIYLASRIDADTPANAKAILDAGAVVSALAALPETDVLYSDETAYLASLPCQRLRIASAAIGALANDAFVWGDAGAPSFGSAGSRIAFVDDSADAADTLRATGEIFDALVTAGYAAGIGSADAAEAPDAESFFEMLRIGGTLAEAAAVAAPYVDSSLVVAGDPLMTGAFSTTGYNVYRGQGDASSVDFDAPIAHLRAGEFSPSLTGLGHDASARYTYVIRPVLNGLEGPDLSCSIEVVTDDEGQWIGNRPAAVETVEAEAGPGGQVTVRWTFRTPYGGAPPADFAIYRSAGRSASPGSPEAVETYVTDGEYTHVFERPDGETSFFAVSARTAQGVESELSPVVGPVVANASAPHTPTVYLNRTFT